MSKLKYDESFPERAVEYAAQGLNNTQIARELGIAEDTFYVYLKQFPAFAEAVELGRRQKGMLHQTAPSTAGAGTGPMHRCHQELSRRRFSQMHRTPAAAKFEGDKILAGGFRQPGSQKSGVRSQNGSREYGRQKPE